MNDNDLVPRVPDRLNQYLEGSRIRFFDTKGSYKQKRDMIPSFIEHLFIDKYIANIEKTT